MLWEYYPDYVANLLYLTARMGIPQDPTLMHFLRLEMRRYAQSREFVVRLADFVENFGGSSAPIQKDLDLVDSLKAEANRLYADQD